MLDRYKKKGGFVQLLTLIETSGKTKQDQFLGLIAQENPTWEAAIRQKSLTIDKILSWPASNLSEVLTRVQPLTVATALSGMPKDKVEVILACLSLSDKRKIQTVIDESTPTPAAVNTCVMKMITETRGFISSGILKMDKVDPTLVIPENFEEQLSNGTFLTPTEPSAASTAEPGSELVFELRTEKLDAKSEHSKDEVEFLKRKVNQLVAENTALKQEVALSRNKLDQIRKIA